MFFTEANPRSTRTRASPSRLPLKRQLIFFQPNLTRILGIHRRGISRRISRGKFPWRSEFSGRVWREFCCTHREELENFSGSYSRVSIREFKLYGEFHELSELNDTREWKFRESSTKIRRELQVRVPRECNYI